MRWKDPLSWNFNIDLVLNRFVPPPPWHYIPYPAAYMLGHRKSRPRDMGNVVPIIWAFVGIFVAISIIVVVSERIPAFTHRGAPIIVGSFGAGAVLEFYAIESPLAQPRNFFLGQILAAVLGVAIGKLFLLSADFESIKWAAGAVSCATVTSTMALTKTVHPPAGATALLAVVDDGLRHLGWFFVPVVMLNCAIMFAVALLVNNVQRTFPSYWWTPDDLSVRARAKESDPERGGPDEEKGGVEESSDRGAVAVEAGHEDTSSHDTNSGDTSSEQTRLEHDRNEVIIQRGKLVLPSHIFLMPEEVQLLEEIGNRL